MIMVTFIKLTMTLRENFKSLKREQEKKFLNQENLYVLYLKPETVKSASKGTTI